MRAPVDASGAGPGPWPEAAPLAARLRRSMILRAAGGRFARAAFALCAAAAAWLFAAGDGDAARWAVAFWGSLAVALAWGAAGALWRAPGLAEAALAADAALGLKDRLVTALEIESRPGPREAAAEAALRLIRRDLAARLPLRLPPGPRPLPWWAPFVPVTFAALSWLRPAPEAAGGAGAGPGRPLDPEAARTVAERLETLACALEQSARAAAAVRGEAEAGSAPEGAPGGLRETASAARETAALLAGVPDAERALALLSRLADAAARAAVTAGGRAAGGGAGGRDRAGESGGDDEPRGRSGSGLDERDGPPEEGGGAARGGMASGRSEPAFLPEELAARARLPRGGGAEAQREGARGEEAVGEPDGTGAGGGETAGSDGAEGAEAEALRAFREDVEALKELARGGPAPEGPGALEFLLRRRAAAARLAAEQRRAHAESGEEEAGGAPAEDSTPGETPGGEKAERGAGLAGGAPEAVLRGLRGGDGPSLSALVRKAARDERARRELRAVLEAAWRAGEAGADREAAPPRERRWVRRYFELLGAP